MFSYLYCGRGFNCLYGVRTKKCLISWSLIILKTVSVNTKGCEMEDRHEDGSGLSLSSDCCDG